VGPEEKKQNNEGRGMEKKAGKNRKRKRSGALADRMGLVWEKIPANANQGEGGGFVKRLAERREKKECIFIRTRRTQGKKVKGKRAGNGDLVQKRALQRKSIQKLKTRPEEKNPWKAGVPGFSLRFILKRSRGHFEKSRMIFKKTEKGCFDVGLEEGCRPKKEAGNIIGERPQLLRLRGGEGKREQCLNSSCVNRRGGGFEGESEGLKDNSF